MITYYRSPPFAWPSNQGDCDRTSAYFVLVFLSLILFSVPCHRDEDHAYHCLLAYACKIYYSMHMFKYTSDDVANVCPYGAKLLQY